MDGDNIRDLEEQARILREAYRPANYGNTITNNVATGGDFQQTNTQEIGLKELMKQRHLHKYERDSLHKPKSDWKETPVGEVLHNSSSLAVEDIISKYKV
jgi:hypothetical protein